MAAVSQQFYQSWRNRLDNFLTAKVVYLPANPAGAEQASSLHAPLLVLSRGCYRESSVSYPVAAISELRKILRQQQPAPGHYHFIGELQDGCRKVLTVAVFPQYLAPCLAARLVIPASLLLASAVETGGSGFIEAVTPDCRFYLQTTSDGLWQSVLENQLIDCAARARLALGVPSETTAQACQLQLSQQISATLQRVPLRFWRSCLQKQAGASSSFDFRPLLYGAGALLFVYLALSSLYLNSTLEQRQQEFARLLVETEQINVARQQLEQDEALLNFLLTQQTKPGLIASFWSVFASWQLSDVQLTLVETDLQRVTLQGEAASATALLQQLLDSPYVKEASFTSSVRRDAQGREAFTLALTLHDDPAVVTVPTAPALDNSSQPAVSSGAND